MQGIYIDRSRKRPIRAMAAPSIQPEAAASRYLNDDVVTEILLRLPSAAVLRFRAVCKAWRRITTSPFFVAAHARRRRPPELIFQRHGAGYGTLNTIPLDAPDETRRIDIRYPNPEFSRPNKSGWPGYILIDSCDGLLLFARGLGTDHFVCNPVTRQWTMLPHPPGARLLPCGFYHHRPSGEHRLLWVTDDQRGSHYVYSLEAAEARRLGPAYPVVPLSGQPPIEHLNHRGKLHWLNYPGVMFFSDDPRDPEAEETYKIMAFDTVSETFRRISRPPGRSDRYRGEHYFLLEMDGMLAMTDILNGSMDLWVLRNYDNDRSWRRRLRVDLPPPLKHASWSMNAGMERQDVLLLGDTSHCSVWLYDMTEKRVLKHTQFEWRHHRLHALVFRDSLKRHHFFDLEQHQ
ncbi:hypothetical protein ACP70R_035866 [Stipagrostis hirtigluma subsp. patula]